MTPATCYQVATIELAGGICVHRMCFRRLFFVEEQITMAMMLLRIIKAVLAGFPVFLPISSASRLIVNDKKDCSGRSDMLGFCFGFCGIHRPKVLGG
ncbi:hypothetical protein [Thiolapillus sp.]